MKLSRAVRRAIFGGALVVLVNLIVLGLHLRGDTPLDTLQTAFNDVLMTRAAKLNTAFIVIAAIDDRTLNAYGARDTTSLDRTHYAELIRQLKAAGAQAVAFDVPLTDPAKDPRQDLALGQAIDEAMNPPDGSRPMPVIMGLNSNGQPLHVPGKGVQFDSFNALAPGIAAGKPITGAIDVDPDGLEVRNLPLLETDGKAQLLSLPLLAASAYARNIPGFAGDFVLEDQPYRLGFGCRDPQNQTDPKCAYQIPTSSAFRMPIYYFTQPDGFAQRAFSVAEIAAGKVNPAALKNALVLVGPYQATGLYDDYPVPTSVNTKMDSVEIWANAATSLILGKFIWPQPAWSAFGFSLGLSLLAGIVFLRFGAFGWLATIVAGGGYTVVRFLIESSQLAAPGRIGHEELVEFPALAYTVVAVAVSAAALFVYLFIDEQRARGAIYDTFGRYVTPAVAQQIAAADASGNLNLGGSRRTATIMFGNLYPPHGTPAHDMLALLNRYWDGIVRKVNDNGGTVNKFIGDHIMVMFNVPLDLPNHAEAACRAAYEALQWVVEHKSGHPDEDVSFGVGINSGPLVAGNMGSKNRMEYTVLGDTVNASSRLSGVAGFNEVIVSQPTVDLLDGSGAKLEDRGEVKVKGRAEPIHIYALQGFVDGGGPVQVKQPASIAAG